MRGKKAIVTGIMILVLSVGWYLSIKKASGIEQREAQNVLVEKADACAENELYVRAIPLYKEALGYDTERVGEIEEKLLSAYAGHDDSMEYVALVEKRIEAGRAGVEEYMAVADYYISRYQRGKAMELIHTGITALGSQKLKDYFEENRYVNQIVITDYDLILPTADNTMMPAFDGTHWVYIDSLGRDTGIGVFDSATSFNADGYAVVSLEGKYYTILEDGDWYGVDSLGVSDVRGVSGSRILACYNGKYGYYSYDFESLTGQAHQYDAITGNRDGVAAVKSGERWGIIKDNGETVLDFILEDVAVNSLGEAYAGGHAMGKQNGRWYLMNTEGVMISEAGFAEAEAPESAGGLIAVANEAGKWGFIDRTGQLVIAFCYDDARSFSNGLGAVKLGETWMYISENNQAVIDSGFEDAQPFHNGIAQVNVKDGAALVILDYFVE